MRELESTICCKCHHILQNLGWDVSQDEWIEDVAFRFDLVLRHNDRVYGFVEILSGDNLSYKSYRLCNFVERYIKEKKPPIFMVTNGYVYDLYVAGKCYGTISAPPTPENIDVLLGGEHLE